MSNTSVFPGVSARSISTTQLLGQVLFLVALAIGFLTLGSVMGKDLTNGAALACFIGGFVMLLAQSFVAPLRTGPLGMGWLFALSVMLGLGLAPTLAEYASTQPDTVRDAAGATALTVGVCGAAGLAISKDLSGWMRPLSFLILGVFGVGLVLVIIGSSSPLISMAIGGLSALLIVVDFNYIRKHGTEDDTIWLATGIFVSIINIFLMFLNLFSD